MTRQQKIKHLEKHIGKVVISINTGNVVVHSQFPKSFDSVFSTHKFYFGY